jgi:hypothetical protein
MSLMRRPKLTTKWVPDGENKYSQSVIDLFDFIRGPVKVVLNDLPLSEYKRALYLVDLSKVCRFHMMPTVLTDYLQTISLAIAKYANTVFALFSSELHPVTKVSTQTMEIQSKLGNKASNWLAKGQQAVKNLEKKKIDGFVIPPTVRYLNINEHSHH